MVLSHQLKSSREHADLTQGQVAKVVGVPRELISMWEAGVRIPSYQHVQALARLYHVSVKHLYGEEPISETYYQDLLYSSVPNDPRAKAEIKRWIDFLDHWCSFLQRSGDQLPLNKKLPRTPGPEHIVTDARRATTLAVDIREFYKLGLRALPDLFTFLDEQGILVYRAGLGSIGKGSEGVSGGVYNHPQLGYCILVNTDTTPGRQFFTLAHEFAHALYHRPVGGIVSRKGDREPRENFADTFAAHFLVPGKELRQLVTEERAQDGKQQIGCFRALQLAVHFGVSYATILNRLRDEKLIEQDAYSEWRSYSPSALAELLRIDPTPFRVPSPKQLHLERYPASVIKRVRRAIESEGMDVREAAELLEVEARTIVTDLLSSLPRAKAGEESEFEELPF